MKCYSDAVIIMAVGLVTKCALVHLVFVENL